MDLVGLLCDRPSLSHPPNEQRKRQIEAQVYALEEELREQGYTDEEVERKSRALRERLERDSKALTTTAGGRG